MDASNFDKLVSAVTKNILEKSGMDINIEKSGNSTCLVMIPNAIFGFKEYLTYIRQRYKGYRIYFSSSESILEAWEIKKEQRLPLDFQNGEFIKSIDTFERIVVIGPKLEILKALNASQDEDDIQHVILGRSMANKAVEIMLNINSNMMNKISGIIADVRKNGIEVTNIQQTEHNIFWNDDLITEKDVMKLKDSGLKKIKLSPTQRMTPLAKDKLSEYKISIEYDKED